MTVAEIQQGLQRLYTSRETGQASPQITAVTLLGSGFEADVFAFSVSADTHAALETRDLILRLYTGQGVGEKAAREFAVMRRLWEADYPVPEVLIFSPQFPDSEHPCLIMERIHGTSLGVSYWGVSEAERRAAQMALSQLMVALHALDGSVILPDSPLVHAQGPYAVINQEIAALFILLDQFAGQEPHSLREALAWLVSRRATVPCEHLAVVHGDFHPNNVLVRDDGVPFVIDWSNVRLGDYRLDIAWSRVITQAEAQPDGGVSDLHLYEQQAGEKILEMEYFEVIACTRLLLSVLISLEFGAAHQGLRPETDTRTREDLWHTRSVAALLHKRTGIVLSDFDEKLSILIGE